MGRKPSKTDEDGSIEQAVRAKNNARERIAFLQSHVLSDSSKFPSSAQLLESERRRAERMSHAELLAQYMQLLAAHLFTTEMLIHQDRHRVMTGISESERVIKVAAIAEQLGTKTRKTKADRQKGPEMKKALDRDGKQSAKEGALALWKDRHAGKHPELRTVEQFAMEVLRRWKVLTSLKVVCGWSATWAKAVAAGEDPVC